jgi:hypothetical protein
MFMKRVSAVTLVLVVALSACGSGRVVTIARAEPPPNSVVTDFPTSTAAAPDTAADRAQVLAATAQQRFGVDNSFGGTSLTGRLLIVDHIEATLAAEAPATGRAFTTEEREAITAAISGVTIEWIDPTADRNILVDGRMPAGTAGVLRLDEPVIDGGHAEVNSSFFCGSLCAIGGATGFMRQPDGSWKSTGQTGPQWIS